MFSLKDLLVPGLLLVIFLVAATAPAGASSQKFVAVAVGHFHTLALADDGTIWKSGNEYTPGSGPYADEFSYVQIPISDVVAIAAGGFHSLALKKDGTVWAWGVNNFGQLGDGTTENRYTPVQVQGLDNVVAISAGDFHSLALKKDGTVWAWGLNREYELGDGTTENRYTPVQVEGLSGVRQIMGPCFAIKEDGTVWAWGKAMGTNGTVPYQVPGLRNVKAIDMDYGYMHALFIKEDGTVWAWGLNTNGQLGDGSLLDRSDSYKTVPVQVKNLKDAKAVSAGIMTSMALKDDGTVWVWGLNGGGQHGVGMVGDIVATPKMVQGLSGVVAISSKLVHSAFLKEDGSVWVCGENGVRNMAAESPVEAYAGKPIKVLGPDSGSSEPAATPDATPDQASNSNNSAPVSQGVIQDNGLLTILLLMLCIAVIIVCAVAYLFVFKRM
ncbi:RCC1 domain-containing protein [Methanocella conradii]|uniref:RCC1 domain-containing protein n=1 Tax=Methanocella conradii TaxID=1175444 RepID=UPI0024B35B53|nr:chromosome condensation regulator RCC1 [Methanocella conradii]MDI6898042.1 chromosome condensation regulator RCC1 [Methanocella conradii]